MTNRHDADRYGEPVYHLDGGIPVGFDLERDRFIVNGEPLSRDQERQINNGLAASGLTPYTDEWGAGFDEGLTDFANRTKDDDNSDRGEW